MKNLALTVTGVELYVFKYLCRYGAKRHPEGQ